MKFSLTTTATLALITASVALPIPSTTKVARFQGSDLLDGIAREGGLAGFLSTVELPFLNPNPTQDESAGGADAGAGEGAGAGAGAGAEAGNP
ncbi:uncharacterized protein BO80DRAFT_426764 [Aspergillus ibericus CBS 121593]|uniref:Uncharacterized protein n=1 Tax=Aspergillus ibericus CBS 121593 TaxID=1448316 RepID=A0A395GUS6_9EURO|nr:hypothetical protein BO80DRAFT_426764 [Aspergillus ibericus CBS 121593]RAK99226.1 hypothetical protein BO80DRAFT_426764 [Aspergillus ibericus CBS 121593]